MHKNRDDETLKSLARHFREVRRNKGMTQTELAEKSGVKQTQIARIETARINTTISTLSALSKAMDITLSELLYGVK